MATSSFVPRIGVGLLAMSGFLGAPAAHALGWRIPNLACEACITSNGCDDEAKAFFGDGWESPTEGPPTIACAGFLACMATSGCGDPCTTTSSTTAGGSSTSTSCATSACIERCYDLSLPDGTSKSDPGGLYGQCRAREQAYVGCMTRSCEDVCAPTASPDLQPPKDPCWTRYTWFRYGGGIAMQMRTRVTGPFPSDSRWTEIAKREDPTTFRVADDWPDRKVETTWKCTPAGLVQSELPPGVGSAGGTAKARLVEGLSIPRNPKKGDTWQARYRIDTTVAAGSSAVTTSAELIIKSTFVGLEPVTLPGARYPMWTARIDSTTSVIADKRSRPGRGTQALAVPLEVSRASAWWADVMGLGLGVVKATETASIGSGPPIVSTTELESIGFACDALGAACTGAGDDCCTGECARGKCCMPGWGACRNDGECCSAQCQSGLCRPP